MTTSLQTMPDDVLLNLSRHLDIRDALSLSMVCRSFLAVAEEAIYWIAALRNTKKLKPIACPSHENLSQLDSSELRRIALHTLRREHNWEQSVPKVMAPIRVIQCDRKHDCVLQVAGTDLLVLHSVDDGNVSCWDTRTSTKVATMYLGRQISGSSPVHEQYRQASIALLLSDDTGQDGEAVPSELVVLRLGYREAPELEIVFRNSLDQTYNHRDPFLNTVIVGVIRLFDLTALDILAFNLSTHQSAVVQSDTHYDAQMGSASLDGNLYIVRDHRDTSYVHLCPNELLPYSDDQPHSYRHFLHCDDVDPVVWTGIDASFSGLEVWFEPLGVITAGPAEGIPVVTLHHIFTDDDTIPRAINVRFWSSRHKATSKNETSNLHPAHTTNIRGMLKFPGGRSSRLCVSTGLHVILVVEAIGGLSLQLIRYNPMSSSSTVHLLDVPDFIDLDDVSSMALDDRFGVVFLATLGGVIYSVPFA